MSSSNIEILIVEDNFSFGLELQMIVEEIGYTAKEIIDNSAEALEYVFSTPPSLILMDIEINGKLSGIELGEKIKHLNIPIIFITSFDGKNYYEQAQKSNIYGFLVKPINKFSLLSSIETAIKSLNTNKVEEQPEKQEVEENAHLFLKKNNLFHRIHLNEICHVEGEGNYAIFYTKDDKFISRQTLNKIETILPEQIFFRTHRSFIINLNQIKSFDIKDNLILMANDQQVLISRNKKQQTLDKLNLLG